MYASEAGASLGEFLLLSIRLLCLQSKLEEVDGFRRHVCHPSGKIQGKSSRDNCSRE